MAEKPFEKTKSLVESCPGNSVIIMTEVFWRSLYRIQIYSGRILEDRQREFLILTLVMLNLVTAVSP